MSETPNPFFDCARCPPHLVWPLPPAERVSANCGRSHAHARVPADRITMLRDSYEHRLAARGER